jgi:hypothetical protein
VGWACWIAGARRTEDLSFRFSWVIASRTILYGFFFRRLARGRSGGATANTPRWEVARDVRVIPATEDSANVMDPEQLTRVSRVGAADWRTVAHIYRCYKGPRVAVNIRSEKRSQRASSDRVVLASVNALSNGIKAVLRRLMYVL